MEVLRPTPSQPPSAGHDPAALADAVLRLTHDVASPLMIISTIGELLLDQPALTAEQRRDIQQILNAAHDAATLVREIRNRAQDAHRSDS